MDKELDKDYISPDGRYYVRQQKNEITMGLGEGHRVNSFGPIEIVDTASDSAVLTLDKEDGTYVLFPYDETTLGWHENYLALMMMPGRIGPSFDYSTVYIAVISMDERAVVQRNRIFYKRFSLMWSEERKRVRIFCSSGEEDWLPPRKKFLENGKCYAKTELDGVTVFFDDSKVKLPDVKVVDAKEIEIWNEDRTWCSFYGNFRGEDAYVSARKVDDHAVLDVWYLRARPESVSLENGFIVPIVSGMKAIRRPFYWDDYYVKQLMLRPLGNSHIEVVSDNTEGLQDWQLEQMKQRKEPRRLKLPEFLTFRKRKRSGSRTSGNAGVIISIVIFAAIAITVTGIGIATGTTGAIVGGGMVAAAGILGGVRAIARNYEPTFSRTQSILRILAGFVFLFCGGAYQVARGFYWLWSQIAGDGEYGWFLGVMEVLMIGCSIWIGIYTRRVHKRDKTKGELFAWLNVLFITMIFGTVYFVASN